MSNEQSARGPKAVAKFLRPRSVAIIGMSARPGAAGQNVYNGLKLLGPTRVTAFQALVPALAVVLAAIFLGEAIRPVQVVGGAVILAGVALVRPGALSRPGRGPFRGRPAR